MASTSLVAASPIGSIPASAPASRPSLSALCTHTPTSSRSGRRWMARMAMVPMPPVDHTATRTGRVGMRALPGSGTSGRAGGLPARWSLGVGKMSDVSSPCQGGREGYAVGDRLQDKVCIVTGAAQGIGAAYARALAREGADVAIIDLKRIDQAGPVKDDIEAAGRRALVIEADVSDADQMAAMGKQVVAELG